MGQGEGVWGSHLLPTLLKLPPRLLVNTSNSVRRDISRDESTQFLHQKTKIYVACLLYTGKLIGERPQDVKKQLDLNGQEVIVDKQSKEILEEWEYEQTEAYSMFEMLITRENEIAAAPTRNDVLLKNKNRQSEGIDRITRFVEREYLGVKPTTKADKKLSKNKKRVTYSGLEALQQAYDAYGK